MKRDPHAGTVPDSAWEASDRAVTRAPGEGGAGFGAQWDPGFVHPVRAALIAPSDEARDLDAVAGALMVDPADAFKSLDADADLEPLDGMAFSVVIAIGRYASVILSQDE